MRALLRLVLASLALTTSAIAFADQPAQTAPPAPPPAAGGTSAPATPPPPVARKRADQPPQPGEDQQARPRRVVRTKKAAPKAPGGPVATYPGFKMLDAGSRVMVEVSRKVDVTEMKAQGRIVYRLRGVATPTRTNRLPLLTGYFPTPVSRVQLVDQGDDVDLVIDLRQATEVTHRVLDTRNGMVLQVDFPKIAAAAAPQKVEDAPAAHAKRGTDTTRIDATSAY